ncbi:ABC transporter ATP-binding protein [Calidithermus chliarophilus]|nr:ABC transporter ATP-binding protein [Calidithermus chliarophilus]
MMLEVIDLSRRYRSGSQWVSVLQNVQLRLREGELLVVAGRSGSGKTTLLHLLAGIDRPDEGKLHLGELVLSRNSPEVSLLRWRRAVGFMHQTPVLIPTLTAWENALLPFRYGGQNPDLAWVKLLFKRLGISGLENRRPRQLSGGQATRVALVRALARRNTLFLADEPTGRLDEAGATAVWGLLLELNRQEGISGVVVTHDPLILKQAHRVLTVQEGRLVEAVVSGRGDL